MTLQLLFDLGGPVMDDTGVEPARAHYGFCAASRSGIYERMREAAARISPDGARALGSLDSGAFAEIYDDAKRRLKKLAKEAEAYSDVNRVAMVMAVSAGLQDYKSLVQDLTEEEVQRFWEELCPNVEEEVYKGINAEFFNVTSEILARWQDARLHLVTDNWPQFYLGAIEPALRRRIGEAKGRAKRAPEFAYRRMSDREETRSRAYISGEGWGNKANPETWGRILNDLGAGHMDTVIFVDDSARKLRGLQRYAEESRLVVPVLVHFRKDEEGETDLTMESVSNIREMTGLVENYA